MLTPSQKKYQTMTRADRQRAKARQSLTLDALAADYCVVPGCPESPLPRNQSFERYGLGRCIRHQGLTWSEIDRLYTS